MNFSSKPFLRAGLASVVMAISLSVQAAVNLGNLPLWFEASRGQTDDTAQYIAHGHDAEFAITPTGAEFSLRQSDGHFTKVQMTFAGASLGSQLAGENELAGKINYLIGNDPAQWRSGVPTFGKVRLDNIYPGVNVVYYGNQQSLEYDFDLAAGVNPRTIAIRFSGAEKLVVNEVGELVIQLNGGQIVQHRPVAYQSISGVQHAVTVGYKIIDARTATFAVENFDHSLPLVIDPVLSYSTFFGGNNGETSFGIAINPIDNSVYIAGQTFSTVVSNGPPALRFASTNGFATNYDGGTILFGDAFVARLDASGTNLLYCTYLGGNKDEVAYGIAVDSAGHAYVTGSTDSTNFPVTNSIIFGTYRGSNISGVIDGSVGHYPSDAFVTELETNGSSLIYSTFLGGSGYENCYAIAVDTTGNAFVTGITYSTNFPFTSDAIQKHLVTTNNFHNNGNGFVSEISAGGTNLNYSTYLGGTNFDVGHAIAYNNGRVFVAGYTTSTNFPWTNGIITCTNLNGFTNTTPGSDAFVSMFATSGTGLTLQYSTFLGSSNNDVATGIAADSLGNAYVVGWTTSTNFPYTVSTNLLQLSSYVRTNSTGFVFATNAFLAKIGWVGGKATNLYSQVFGGPGVDVANAVTLDASGNIFIVGSASSTNFPVTPGNLIGSLRATNSSSNDGFAYQSDAVVIAFQAGFTNLLYSAYLGGSGNDFGYGIAVDSTGNAYITGQTLSTNFPVFSSWSTNSPALHSTMVGTNDAFVTKIATSFTPPSLSLKSAGKNVLVYWPPTGQINTNTLGLQTSTNLLTTNWTVVTNLSPVLTNGNYIYTFNPTNRVQFFRLFKF